MTLVMTGHQDTMMRITFLCGMVTVLLSVWVVKYWGAQGVAASAAFGMTLQNISMLLSAKKHTGLWTHMNFRKNFLFAK